jgi:hypothetical protein
MELSQGDGSAQNLKMDHAPHLPRLWIGYVLGAVTLVAEIVAVALHPEIAKLPLVVPPLYLFLPSFISLVYWLVCVYQYHLVLAGLSAGSYPIRALRAAWFHLIPLYQFYWAFRWSRDFASFINSRGPRPVMKPGRTGLVMLSGFLIFILLDRGFGLILLCVIASKLSAALQQVLEQSRTPGDPLPPW